MYGEWLVLISTVYNFLTLLFTAKVTGYHVRLRKLLVSSFSSSLVAVLFGQTIVGSVVSLILLIGLAFDFKFSSFRKQGPIVVIATVAVGGLLTAIQPYLKSLSLKQFFIICIVLAICLLVVFAKQWHFVKKEQISNQFVRETNLTIFNTVIPLKAFIDSGNQCQEPMSGKPVHFISYEAVRKHLPENLEKSLSEWQQAEPYNVSMFDRESQQVIRFIRLSTVQQRDAVVLGFRFEKWHLLGELPLIIKEEYVVFTKMARQFPQSTSAILHFSALSQ
ncbi:MAG: sigma-E processing peptidase SpoIIGA [Lysinibacillus sp.]